MKTSKIFKRVLIVLAMLALVSAILTSSTYARYVCDIKRTYDTRPAMFDVEFADYGEPKIEMNLARDGAPASAIGHTEVTASYDFRIDMKENEVRVKLDLGIDLTKISSGLVQLNQEKSNYKDLYVDGIRWSYKVYRVEGKGTLNEKLTLLPDSDTSDFTKWSYSEEIDPLTSPVYRLEFTFYNNTLATNNQADFFTAYQGVTITATGTQVEPVLD